MGKKWRELDGYEQLSIIILWGAAGALILSLVFRAVWESAVVLFLCSLGLIAVSSIILLWGIYSEVKKRGGG